MKVLYGVSSLGLGHVRRSLQISEYLRKLGEYEIEWIAAEPSLAFLEKEGEKLLPVSGQLKSLSPVMENKVRDGKLSDISQVARDSSREARKNYVKLKPFLGGYDALIQDEFPETMFSFMWDKYPPLPRKRVVITDYFQLETVSLNLVRRFVTWYANRLLLRSYLNSDLRIFADEAKSVPKFEIVGAVLGDPPKETREELRKKLFSVAGNPVIAVSVGGTSIGKYLVDFIFSNEKKIRAALGNASFVFLLGARIGRALYPENSDGLQFVPFTTDSPSYFKASDCVITQAGASTLNEVASIGTPCVAVPIKNHWEQQASARKFSERYGFQIVQYDELGVEAIVSAINGAMNSKYEPMRPEGATKAAKLIHDYLS